MVSRTLQHMIGDTTTDAPPHPVVARRRTTALALTAFTVALGVLFVVAFGPGSLFVYLPALPMAFVLLWGSVDALRFDDEAVEEEDVVRPPSARTIAEHTA